jgi:hypothetical protein
MEKRKRKRIPIKRSTDIDTNQDNEKSERDDQNQSPVEIEPKDAEDEIARQNAARLSKGKEDPEFGNIGKNNAGGYK